MMTPEEKEIVCQVFENEGIEYGLNSYTDFREHDTVNDPEFHRLKDEFLAIRRQLIEYVGYDTY